MTMNSQTFQTPWTLDDVDSLDVSGFNVDVDPEPYGQQVDCETGIDHSESSTEESSEQSSTSSNENEIRVGLNCWN